VYGKLHFGSVEAMPEGTQKLYNDFHNNRKESN